MKENQQVLFEAENSPRHVDGRPAGRQEFLPLWLTGPGKLLWAACVNRLLMIDAGIFYVTK